MRTVLFLLLTLAFIGGATAQTKATLSTSSLTVLTGTASRTALVDAQSAVTPYGTWATNTTAGTGTSTTPTRNAVVKITADSTKTYKNLFVCLTGTARVRITTSTDDSAYSLLSERIISGNGLDKQWRTIPVNRSSRYFKIEFRYLNSRAAVHEIALTK